MTKLKKLMAQRSPESLARIHARTAELREQIAIDRFREEATRAMQEAKEEGLIPYQRRTKRKPDRA